MSMEQAIYKCTGGGTSAFGYPSPGGFTGLKGSAISERVAPSFEYASKYYFQLRNRLIDEEIIRNNIFRQDYEFTSATATAVSVGWTINKKQHGRNQNLDRRRRSL